MTRYIYFFAPGAICSCAFDKVSACKAFGKFSSELVDVIFCDRTKIVGQYAKSGEKWKQTFGYQKNIVPTGLLLQKILVFMQ